MKNVSSLRVLMVTPNYYPHMGGVETHVDEVGKRLIAKGVHVKVLTTRPDNTWLNHEVRDGLPIERVRAWPGKLDYYYAPDMLRVIAEEPWDVIHCQGCHTLVPPMSMFAAQKRNIPYVLTFHTGGHSSKLRQMVRGMQWTGLRPLLAKAQRLIGVSDFEAEYFQNLLHLPAEQFTVIPNGAALPDISAVNFTPTDRTLIVSPGRLERYKGHQRMIAAMPAILERYPKAYLRVLGSGPYEAELHALVAQMNLEKYIEIGSIPPTERHKMAEVLSEAAVVTLMSDYEAHPIAVMEALAIGRPVLATATSGLQELADKGMIRTIPLTSTPEQIAIATAEQIEHPLIPKQVNLPTWEQCVDALIDVYQQATQEQQQAS